MNYISLFDYLGKAAGPALGDRVNTYSQIHKQPFKQREISNPAYTGKVFLYKKSFLDEFFKVEKIFNKHVRIKKATK